MTNIAFAGLTAAGKTTHARRLATDLGFDYVSATDILFEILRVPRDAHPWFSQGDAINAARQDGTVDAELESRLVDIFKTRADNVVFVKGDPDLDFQTVATAIDIAHSAGVDKVGLMTPKVEEGH